MVRNFLGVSIKNGYFSLFKEKQEKVEVGAKRKSELCVELKKFEKTKKPRSYSKRIKDSSTRFSLYSITQKWLPFFSKNEPKFECLVVGENQEHHPFHLIRFVFYNASTSVNTLTL